MLKQRIITAVILAVVVVGTIVFAEPFWVQLLFAVVLLVATREMLTLTIRLSDLALTAGSFVFVMIFWWSLPLVTPVLIFWQSLAGLVLWGIISLGLIGYRHNGHWPLLVRIMVLGLSLDLLWICVHSLVYLYFAYGWEILFYLFSLVWIADIGAYFSGRRFGKHKLAPAISPGKTWEGVAGGLLANLVWIVAIYQLGPGWGMSLTHFLVIGIATTMISVVGDLFESILKREAGVKDSGKLLPGHGGILDRIDSIIAAAPVFVAGIFIAGQL